MSSAVLLFPIVRVGCLFLSLRNVTVDCGLRFTVYGWRRLVTLPLAGNSDSSIGNNNNVNGDDDRYESDFGKDSAINRALIQISLMILCTPCMVQ